jgi:tetratricopeptide (TPR) repeat protein
MPERIEQPSVRIEHYGYLGAVRDSKEKSRRNIELLERQVADGERSPFLAFNLGSEYAAAGDAKRALTQFQEAWNLLVDDPERTAYGFAPSLTNRLVKALRTNGRLKEAVERADDGLEMFPGFTDLVLEKAYVARLEGDLDRAVELVEKALKMGDAPSRYSAMVGSGTYIALGVLADIRRDQGDFPETERLLMESLREHPGFLGAVHPLAAIMLAQQKEPKVVAETIESVVETLTPSAHFMLGSALYEQKHAEAAEEQFRAVLAKQPSNDSSRVALSETLLSQSRWEEAAEAAAEVDDLSAYAAPARRSELFARIMMGERAGTESALSRGVESGMLPADVQLYRAWHEVRGGGSLPVSLPVEAGALLAITLEALLRVEEIEAFAELVPLVDRVGIAWRERRELLGVIYLRRGYLESAGDEWIAVCEETGPDARALVGLAQVAIGRGMKDDALVFAESARELEPANPIAKQLVEALALAA